MTTFIEKVKKATELMNGKEVDEDPDPLPEPEEPEDDANPSILNLEDDEYLYDPEEEMIYDSPLEKPEAPVYFRETMTMIQENDAELANQILMLVPEDVRASLEESINDCEIIAQNIA